MNKKSIVIGVRKQAFTLNENDKRIVMSNILRETSHHNMSNLDK